MVQEIKTLAMVGEGSIFSLGPHVRATQLAYFKPPMDDLLTTLETKDRRSAKGWEYINAESVWADMSISALTIAKTTPGTAEELGARLALAEKALVAVCEMLTMIAQ